MQDPTAVPTEVPTEAPTEIPEPEVEEVHGTPILVKVSHYNPSLGGVNCFSFVNGECVSKMSSGLRWQEWMDKAIACPSTLPFWTRIVVDGREWICLDRGGAIVMVGDVYWIDQLTTTPEYRFGTVVEAEMFLP